MSTKKILVSGIIGGIVDFLLGWVFYGILFTNLYPASKDMNLFITFLGCLTFGLFVAYIFVKWAGIKLPITGLKAGAIIGFFTSLSFNLFQYSNKPLNYQNIILDVAISIIIGSLVGTAVALILGKMK